MDYQVLVTWRRHGTKGCFLGAELVEFLFRYFKSSLMALYLNQYVPRHFSNER